MRWRTGDKEKKKNMFLQSIPGIICAEQPERWRKSRTSCCLFMKHPLGEIINLYELISPFLTKKYKEARRKTVEEQGEETTLSRTNSSKEHLSAKQIPQKNF